MRYILFLFARLRGTLFCKKAHEAEMQAEFESHLTFQIDENLRRGMDPATARRHALLQSGGLEAAREAYREQSRLPFLEHLLLDTRFAFRQMRRNPGFFAAAILVLTLAFSSSVSIFTFVDAALLKPLPYKNPDRLVLATESGRQFPVGWLSYPDFLDWKTQNTVFESFDVSRGGGFMLKTRTGTETVPAAYVSPGFLGTLGIRPAIGRDFRPDEVKSGGSRTILLTHRAWKRWFAGRKSVVGEGVTLSGVGYTVVGVLPEHFQFAPRGRADFWTVIDATNPCVVRRSCHNLQGIARLKPGVTVQAAAQQLKLISHRLEKQYPDSNRDQGATALLFSDALVSNLRPVLLGLLGGVLLLVAIACVNVVSLLLLRGEKRRREMALRQALGASTQRLAKQVLVEGALVVFLASFAALILAHPAIAIIKSLIPADMIPYLPFLAAPALSWRVLGFAAGLSALALAIFALTPLVHLAGSRLRDALAEGNRGSSGAGWQHLGARLVTVELAIAMVLLVSSALLAKSFYRLMAVDLGFNVQNLVTIDVATPAGYSDGFAKVNLRVANATVDALKNTPGVQSVALTTIAPVSGNGNTDWIRFVGKPYDGHHIEVNERDVSPDYFRTLATPLQVGRYFTQADNESAPKVVIVNESLVRKYFPNEDPIGRQLGDQSLSPKSLRTIVGVVKDMREGTLDSEIVPAEYHPFAQDPGDYFTVIARTPRPELLLPILRPILAKAEPNAGLLEESLLETTIANSMTAYLHRSTAWLVTAFAGAAFALGIVGLYGVVSYSVSQRTREIGIRMALGAEQNRVYGLVLGQAGRLVGLGVGAGLVLAMFAMTAARKLLFGVSAYDLPTLAAVALVLGISALIAGYFPARRAARINPCDALRSE